MTGRRPKLVLSPSRYTVPAPGVSAGDFEIYASYRGSPTSGFFGTLKVVRKTDGRLLFPFDGAETIGPYSKKDEAVNAASARGSEIVQADIRIPEM
ncbi:hypothetical protein P9250_02515 [Caballeronia sp. LP006]|uniref:DUF6723 family protein n=1 Tax=unclassified Caballeronia TaxID=2646786 RepID=UPI002027CDCD|nr:MULTISPECIES: DUF6723 family protein [unclassified Caballeronia]MDR5773501.1 hypothetical protein [Caballeronia sp. LZ002]MDR5806279.1 hypothetical protein [Caballeronia sp. LZ001]MDR5826726.1 hypothetical protein [Caballeronia sp. LP006]MDR5848935.1 hypothetical protein [Caballeronia sp. LZ003]